MPSLRRFYLLITFLASFVADIPANQITWGTSLSLTDVNFTSKGAPLDNSFTFALGTFGASFDPAANQVDLWASQWKVLDTAAYNPAFDYFTSETSLSDNSVFAAGEKAYIWIYNTQAVSTATEWLLVHGVDQNTAPWQIPAAPAGVTSFPLDFRISRVTETLFGGFNSAHGPGDFSASPGSFTLQTHTFPSLAIPEPGTAGLLAGVLAGLFRRRRGAPPPAPLPHPESPGPRNPLKRRLFTRLGLLAMAAALPPGQPRRPIPDVSLSMNPLALDRPARSPAFASPVPDPDGTAIPFRVPGMPGSYQNFGRSVAGGLPVLFPSGTTRNPRFPLEGMITVTANLDPAGTDGAAVVSPNLRPALQGIAPPVSLTASSDEPPSPAPPGSISGLVREDTDDDNLGDQVLAGIILTLKDADGNDIDSDGNADGVQPTTTATDPSGSYRFTGLAPGSYRVIQTQPAGYVSVADVDGDNLDEIGDVELIVVRAGADTPSQNFVEERIAGITGFVLLDTDNDGIGNAGMIGVTLTLFTDPDGDGNPADGMVLGNPETTAADGSYAFSGLPAGGYVVVQSQPDGFLDVSDSDRTTDVAGSPPDASNQLRDNLIPVRVRAGETDTGNTFVEVRPGSISGLVLADTDNDNLGDDPVADVILTLRNGNGTPFDRDPDIAGIQPYSVAAAANGSYNFINLPAGSYQVEQTQPAGYFSVSDADGGNPDLIGDISPIVLSAGAAAANRNFIEEQPGSLSGAVLADTDNDDLGDAGLENVILTLLNGAGQPVDGNPMVPGVQPVTAATNGSGQFLFGNLRPGTYGVRQTQPTGFISVSDSDGGHPDEIRPINVTAGATSGGHTFVEEQPASISGLVLADTNNNDTGDSPVAGVILTLKGAAGQDMDSDPVAPGIQPTTTTTGSDGRYNLTNLPPGFYRVVQTQPAGFFSVTDSDGGNPDVIGDITPIELKTGGSAVNKNFIEEQPGSLGGTVLADTDSNGSGDTALPLVLLTLKDGAGADLDSNPVLGGVQPTVTVTASNGSYLFAGLSPGFYQVWQTQPAGYLSIDDADGGNPDRIGDPVPIMVSAGNVTGGRNFLEKPEPPDRFDEWKNANGLTGMDGQPLPDASGQGGNPDTDLYSNLLEYAFGFPPRSGVHPEPAGEVRVAGDGRISYAVTYNNAPVDLVISLEVAGGLGTPVVWAPAGSLGSTVTDNLDGTSTILFEDLESLGAAFADGDGFVRVRVGLDQNGDSSPDLFDYAPVTGWTDHTHRGRIPSVMDNQATTFAMPYLGPPLISGAVTGNTANGLDLTDAAGGISLVATLSPAKRYFVEITGGSLEGHRFEIEVAASTATVAALKSVSRVHTRSLTAGALTGAPVVIRELAVFDRLFPPAVFLAGTSSSDADSLLVYRGTAWITYFLADLGVSKRWVRAGDASLADQGGEIVAPGEGLFVRRRGASLTIARHGFVRTNAFALPLTGGGSVLVGSAYPLDQSYATRGMTVAAGFQGGVDLALASRVLFWTGDAVPGALGYATDFLLDGSSPALRYWAGGSDSFLTDKSALPLFKATGAAFLSLPVALPGYVMPAPWSNAP